MRQVITFGNKDTFKIRYVPNVEKKESKYQFASIHLILDNKIIGDPSENSMIGTWMLKMKKLLHKLKYTREKLFHKDFEGKTDIEIFKLVHKSNQIEEEYEEKYQYLPILPYEIWENCCIRLDETIDDYLIVIICLEDTVKFIWKELGQPCSQSKADKIFSTEANYEYVISTISESVRKIKT